MTGFDSGRRKFLQASGAALTVAIAGCSGGGSSGNGGGVPSEVKNYLSEAKNYDGLKDKTGNSEVTVKVGAGSSNLAFGPAAIRVDSGTKVVWEWTGKGGSHNVVHKDGSFKSKLKKKNGATFSHTFDSSGNYLYYCAPHKSVGMKGAVVVK